MLLFKTKAKLKFLRGKELNHLSFRTSVYLPSFTPNTQHLSTDIWNVLKQTYFENQPWCVKSAVVCVAIDMKRPIHSNTREEPTWRTSGHQAEHGKHMQTCLDTFAVVTSGCLAREGEAKIRNFRANTIFVMKTYVSKAVSLFGTWLALSWDLFFLILVKLLSRMLRGFFEGRIL